MTLNLHNSRRQKDIERMTISKDYRIAHSRFNGNQQVTRRDSFDRVVTSVWSYENGVIRYGATVYKRNTKNVSWNRKDHIMTALNRYMRFPVFLRLKFGDDQSSVPCPVAIDWFIAKLAVEVFGCLDKNNSEEVQGPVNYGTSYYFNKRYDPRRERYENDDTEWNILGSAQVPTLVLLAVGVVTYFVNHFPQIY